MRRVLPLLAALAAAACSRDLSLPGAAPPSVTSIQLAGLAPSSAPVPLPVLGGELVAVEGAGFPTSASQLQVQVGNGTAEVLDLSAGRMVLRVPALSAIGPADLQLATPTGLLTVAGALRYDGPGQPLGLGSTDVPSSTLVGFVAPVQGFLSRFPPYAIATGAGDSALLVAPGLNAAVTTIPLGLVPASAAAWIQPTTAPPGSTWFEIDVLAASRSGSFSAGSVVIDGTGAVVSRVAPRALAHLLVNPKTCTPPQLLSTPGNVPVVAWQTADLVQHVATADPTAIASSTGSLGISNARTLPAPMVGWSPWSASSVVVATASDLLVYDAAAATTTSLAVVRGGVSHKVTDLVAAACPQGGPVTAIRNVAVASWNGSDALALAYVAGNLDRIALVDLTPGPTSGTVRTGALGNPPTALALAPVPPFDTPTAWAVLGAGLSTLLRATPVAGAPACEELVPDAALSLSAVPGFVAPYGGMTVATDGTRILTTTPDGDLWTVLPPSMTSAGPVLRLASYAGLSLQAASIGGVSQPAIAAEHAWYGDVSTLDTGSAVLFFALDAGAQGVALGGSGYGRGAIWLDTAPGVGGTLAYTGELPPTSVATTSVSGGAGSVTGFDAGTCPGEDVHITSSRSVKNGPDLVTQGPGRSGALGPEGVARYGPASPPVYTTRTTAVDSTLHVYATDVATLGCLTGPGTPDWDPAGACTPAASVALPLQAGGSGRPLDVTLSAGDRAAAVRSLSPTCVSSCAVDDDLCLRTSCSPARTIELVYPGGAPGATATLPTSIRGIAAHPAGGFLATLRCATPPASGPLTCFPGNALCAALGAPSGTSNGALVFVPESGAPVSCLAVLPGLGGPIAVTPNGAEAWVTGNAGGTQVLLRLDLPRRTSDGAVDGTVPATPLSVEALGTAATGTGSFPPGGVAFSPDGTTGVVTVPAAYRIVLYQ
jgi:hypothetical protein